MANSKYEYVKLFERENYLLPDTYIVLRVDGKGFHKFSAHYEFDKPNDERALQVMNRAALSIMAKYPDVTMAYGDSDEYLFLLRKQCQLYERREMKLTTTFAAAMSVEYYYWWSQEFPDKPLSHERLPQFDCRAVVYPNITVVKDYFRWRQVDCHINNLYNTSFWTLVLKGNLTPQQAEQRLMGTVSSDKNEILFSEFGINYNNEPDMYKKGTTLVREMTGPECDESGMLDRQKQRQTKQRRKAQIVTLHCDIINEQFWTERPYLE